MVKRTLIATLIGIFVGWTVGGMTAESENPSPPEVTRTPAAKRTAAVHRDLPEPSASPDSSGFAESAPELSARSSAKKLLIPLTLTELWRMNEKSSSDLRRRSERILFGTDTAVSPQSSTDDSIRLAKGAPGYHVVFRFQWKGREIEAQALVDYRSHRRGLLENDGGGFWIDNGFLLIRADKEEHLLHVNSGVMFKNEDGMSVWSSWIAGEPAGDLLGPLLYLTKPKPNGSPATLILLPEGKAEAAVRLTGQWTPVDEAFLERQDELRTFAWRDQSALREARNRALLD